MKPEEAKEELKRFVKTKTTMQPVFLDVCLDALEKQTPKKPLNDKIEGHCGLKCANCRKQVWIHQAYCENCGQALKWEEEK